MATLTELRNLLVQLSSNADRDLAALWAQLDRETVKDGLMDVMPALIGDYGDAAAVVTADWYDDYRGDRGVGGIYTAEPFVPDLGPEALAGWGSALAQGNWDTALSKISGGVASRLMTASRATITDNTFLDPDAAGWQRLARPDGCGFCQMLAGRAELYRSRGTADFASHDGCHCTAIPAFGGQPVPVKPYTPTSRNISDADRARTREWIKANL